MSEVGRAVDPSPTTIKASTTTIDDAKGKPCVSAIGPMPGGAPLVPVPLGPPPRDQMKQDLVVGTGAPVTDTSNVTVKAVGVACSTGELLVGSHTDDVPFTIRQGPKIGPAVLWQFGLRGMKVGGQRLVGLPDNTRSASPGIAPNEYLWYLIEVTAVS